MKEELLSLIKNSYSPYSKYAVSAIVLTNDGNKFKGVNVENASFGGTICAERNAINNAISNGYKRGDFKALYVMVKGDNIAFPCFICRQTIVEFFKGEEMLVLFSENSSKSYLMNDILTHPFSVEDLKWSQGL